MLGKPRIVPCDYTDCSWHGRAHGRYAALIAALVQSGMVVYGNDHRGHGHTCGSSKRIATPNKRRFAAIVFLIGSAS